MPLKPVVAVILYDEMIYSIIGFTRNFPLCEVLEGLRSYAIGIACNTNWVVEIKS